MDTEPGSVFSSNDFVRGTHVEQASSRHCVPYRQTSLSLHTRKRRQKQGAEKQDAEKQDAEKQAQLATRRTSM